MKPKSVTQTEGFEIRRSSTVQFNDELTWLNAEEWQ